MPDARLYQSPAESAEAGEIVPFSVLYVYDKAEGWLRVGYDSFGSIAGWVSG